MACCGKVWIDRPRVTADTCLIPIPSIWLSCARQLPHVPAALESKSPSRNYDNWRRRRVWGACDTGASQGHLWLPPALPVSHLCSLCLYHATQVI